MLSYICITIFSLGFIVGILALILIAVPNAVIGNTQPIINVMIYNFAVCLFGALITFMNLNPAINFGPYLFDALG